MAEHRPLSTLQAWLQQALSEHPAGLAPRQLLDHLSARGEAIARPTLNRLLAQGVQQGLWALQGAGRSITYTLGAGVATLAASPDFDETVMTQSPKSPSPKRGSARKSEPAKPLSVYQQVQAVVWGIADTLRDKTGLQVESYQPVTLALMGLKRHLDIQAEQLRDGGLAAQILADHYALMVGGFQDPRRVAQQINLRERAEGDCRPGEAVLSSALDQGGNSFWDSKAIAGDRFGLPVMTWADLVGFQGGPIPPASAGHVLILRANPEGHRTAETALFTYTTQAQDFKSLLLELLDSLVPDLREAYGAIGIHNVLGPQSEHSASLSNPILRDLCTLSGEGSSRHLADFDLGLDSVSQDVFSDTYMNLLQRFAETSGKRGGEYFTPTPLVDNIIRFLPLEETIRRLSADPTQVLRVADPTSGSNTFLLKYYEALVHEAKRLNLPIPRPRQFAFFAQELKNTQVGLGIINLFHHGLVHRLNLTESEIYTGRAPSQGGLLGRTVGNSIGDYAAKIGQQANKVDVVLGNPPYGVDDYGVVYASGARNHPADHRWGAGVPTRSEGEWAFIQTAVDLISPAGRGALVMPMGVLFRDGGRVFREWLIEKDWIEGVITTPANQFLTTTIPVCLVFFNKAKPAADRDSVFIINASEDFTKVGKFNHWNVDRALQAWHLREENPGYSGRITVDRLRKAAGYPLTASRWFAPQKEKQAHDPQALTQKMEDLHVKIQARSAWLNGLVHQVLLLDPCQRIASQEDEEAK